MDISGASSVSATSGQSVGGPVQNEAVKKTQESPAAVAHPVQETKKPSSVNLPAHLGQNINTTA